MKTGKLKINILLCALFIYCIFPLTLFGESLFDFGLPLFKQDEVRFEKTKLPDFNFQLMKKYLSEHKDSPLHHFHAISKWYDLIKLSDKPRQKTLRKVGIKFFEKQYKQSKSPLHLLQEIFAKGLLLSHDKSSDPASEKDEKFESLLLKAEDKLGDSPDYSLAKGILFYLLRSRPNHFFAPMQPAEDLKRALANIPRTAHYYYVLGQAFRFIGNKESNLFLSIAAYEKSAALDPRNPKLQNSLLGIYMGIHEDYQSKNKSEPFWLEEAVYKKILALSPNNPYALNNLGYLYAEFGVNSKVAEQLCQKAVDLRPNNPGFHDSLGWAAFKNQNYDKAEKELKKSLAIKKNVYEPLYHLATLYYVQEKYALASEYYSQAIQIRPDSAEALNNLAYLLAEQDKNLEDALKMSERAVKLDPNNPSYIDTLGWLQFKLGDVNSAELQLKKAAQLAPGQAEILFHIGKVLLDKSEFSEAISYLKEAHKADPNFKETEDALYLALCLKSRLTTLSSYHKLFGEKANKDRICNILLSLARLYQEEKLYEKAIKITKLCADIKKGRRSLNKPIFNYYKLKDQPEKTKTPPQPTSKPVEKGKEPAKDQKSNNQSLKIESFPPVVICFGPKLFKLLEPFVPSFASLSRHSVTILIRNIMKPSSSAVLRIESADHKGTELFTLAESFFIQLSGNRDSSSKQANYSKISLANFHTHIYSSKKSIYLSTQALKETSTLSQLDQICPHKQAYFIAFHFNWSKFQNQLPVILRPFISNPFEPFYFIYSKYDVKDGILIENSALKTKETIDESFMKKLAKKLFTFKLAAKKLGINITIRLKHDNGLIHLSSEFEGLKEYISQKISPYLPVLKFSIVKMINSHICFINRLLYSGNPKDLANLCPKKGEISCNPYSGLLNCSSHFESPIHPFFMTLEAAKAYSKYRLDKLVELFRKNKNKKLKIEALINKLIQEYKIPFLKEN
jgi:tetratricopeptide (TPR) repeat protein